MLFKVERELKPLRGRILAISKPNLNCLSEFSRNGPGQGI